MEFAELLKPLGPVDVSPLVDAVTSLDREDWQAQSMRQDEFEVHRKTKSIVLLFLDADAWPEVAVTREHGWGRLAGVVMPIVEKIVERHYPPGGIVLRAMLAKLPPGEVISPHVDRHESFHVAHRIHVPVTTNSRVRFYIEGRPYKFATGQAYELNNQRLHSVMNKGCEDRITLIFDYMPPPSKCG